MDFEEAADRLYAIPAADFIATRNELAKQLKADGDQLGSTRLKALRKPTVAAWVANLVAHNAADDLDDLIALGDEFREATADMDGDRLRELTPRRHQLLDKLVKEAGRLAKAADQKVSADVTQKLRETLDAALVDPAAGDAVREGRLSSALRHVGFGVVDENGEPTNVTPLTDERREAARARRKTQQADEAADTKAEAEKDRAQREAEEREAAARAEAKRAFEEAVATAQAAEARVEDLDKQLDDARDALAEAQQLVHNLGAELDEARRTARDAQKESREARKRYNRM
ncbi:hypothetical protein GCM10029976_051150 [Kribbella albertanoniae]|uniref:Uncharacterized protein n=1 Tax=Kribbella albertanoniae TaxID=1266829 RepID=A0A4R4PLM6_9ACTN|nr:hypothetical protein [Kribbella albertanoniae]TDC23002.1 hypothetical protein E1261_29535 [Kribbella albertanoniae]